MNAFTASGSVFSKMIELNTRSGSAFTKFLVELDRCEGINFARLNRLVPLILNCKGS